MNPDVLDQFLYERLMDFQKKRRKLWAKGRQSEGTYISGRISEIRVIRKELKKLKEAKPE